MNTTPEPRVKGPLYEREIARLVAKLSGPVRQIEYLLVDLYVNFFVNGESEVVVRLSRYYLARSYREDAEQALAYFRGYELDDKPYELIFDELVEGEPTGRISLRLR